MAQQYQAKDSSLTLYLNSLAHVATAAQLQTGDGAAQITGIANKFVPESIHTILDSKGLRITGSKVLEPTTLAEIAEQNLGRNVTYNNESYEALAVQGDQLIARRAGDQRSSPVIISRPLADFQYSDQKDLRQRQAVELTFGELGNELTNVQMAYLVEGIGLTPHYNIILADGKLRLVAQAKIDNESGKAYSGVEFETIPANVGKPILIREEPVPIRRRFARVATVGAMICSLEEGVTEFEEGGQIGYAFGKRDIPQGTSTFGIFSTQSLDYQMVYTALLGVGGGARVKALLRFKTPQTLPVGSVAVYGQKQRQEDGDEKIERYEGGGGIQKPVLKDGKVEIELREPSTLDVKVKKIGESRITRTGIPLLTSVYAIERDFEVTIANGGTHDANIEAHLGLDFAHRVTQSSYKPKENKAGNRVQWDVTVETGKTLKFTYTLHTLQFRPLSHREVERILKEGDAARDQLLDEGGGV